MAERPSFDDYYLGIAEAVAARADCTRRKAGAVIVKDATIVGHGYNGAPPGKPGCLSDGACPRGRHYQVSTPGFLSDGLAQVVVEGCGCGGPWPCPDYVKPMSSYDTGKGSCISLHAEQNAIIRAGFDKCRGATIYVVSAGLTGAAGAPCEGCQRLIEGAGITRVVCPS